MSSRMGQLLGSSFQIVNGNSNGSTHDLEDDLVDGEYYPVSGSFIDASGAERVHALIEIGTTDNIGTFKLYEHDSATGTPTEVNSSYYTHTFAADDDGEYACITLEVARMSLDHHFLTTLVNVTGTSKGTITYLLEMYGELPAAVGDMPAASRHYFTG